MPKYFKVAQGGAILKPKSLSAEGRKDSPIGRGLWRSGEVVTDEQLPAESIDSLIRSGHLVPVNAEAHAEAPLKPGAVAPVDTTNEVLRVGENEIGLEGGKPVGQQVGKWTFSDNDLAGKDVEALNELIAEQGGEFVFDTPEEAKAFLQSDLG